MGPALIRQVRWVDLPLGAVVLEGPRLYHALIPELAGYPVLTPRLRAELWARYQLGPSTLVTIADPALQLETVDFAALDREGRRWIEGLAPLIDFKARSRKEILGRPDARRGLVLATRAADEPFVLTKDWARSTARIVQDFEGFGAGILGPGGLPETLGQAVGRLLAGTLPRWPLTPPVIDVGLDASFSMAGKAEFAYQELAGVLGPLTAQLGACEWRLWTYGDQVRPARLPLPPGSSETHLAPFLRRVLEADRPGVPHLCLVITDGLCQDRPEALRLLERLGRLGIDYLQLILAGEDDFRRYTWGAEALERDGVVPEGSLGPDQEVLVRSDEEWEALRADELARVTDLAEAARGGQLVVTWTPLFRLLALDVYERYLGRVVLTPDLIRPRGP